MPMGNIWAWPSKTLSTDQTLKAMINFGRRLVINTKSYDNAGHPLEITHELSEAHKVEAALATLRLPEPIPRLAQLVAASPLEAAIHDAYGKALGQNSYNLLSAEYVSSDLSAYLTADFAGEYLDRYTLR